MAKKKTARTQAQVAAQKKATEASARQRARAPQFGGGPGKKEHLYLETTTRTPQLTHGLKSSYYGIPHENLAVAYKLSGQDTHWTDKKIKKSKGKYNEAQAARGGRLFARLSQKSAPKSKGDPDFEVQRKRRLVLGANTINYPWMGKTVYSGQDSALLGGHGKEGGHAGHGSARY